MKINCLFYAAGPFHSYTRHEPVGVCGQIIPVRKFTVQKHSVNLFFYTKSKATGINQPFIFETKYNDCLNMKYFFSGIFHY